MDDDRQLILNWLRAQKAQGEAAIVSAKDGSREQRDYAAGVVVVESIIDAIKRGEYLPDRMGDA